jgi:hypothetical protein
MNIKQYYLVVLGLLIAAAARGAESEEAHGAESKETPPQEVVKLPKPLEAISCNIRDLEKSGFFQVTGAAFGAEKELGEEALIWKVKVVQTLTLKHAMLLLRNVRDCRFFRIEKDLKDLRTQLLTAELAYPASFDYGAVHHGVLHRNEEFQIWVLLNAEQIRMLQLHKANRLVFGPTRQKGRE